MLGEILSEDAELASAIGVATKANPFMGSSLRYVSFVVTRN